MLLDLGAQRRADRRGRGAVLLEALPGPTLFRLDGGLRLGRLLALHPCSTQILLLPPLVLHDRSGAKHTPESEALLRGEAALDW